MDLQQTISNEKGCNVTNEYKRSQCRCHNMALADCGSAFAGVSTHAPLKENITEVVLSPQPLNRFQEPTYTGPSS
jgi:hypothetical protein